MSDPDRPEETPETPETPPTRGLAPHRHLEEDEPSGPSPVLLLAAIAALLALGAGVVLASLNRSPTESASAPVVAAPAPTGPTVHLKLFVEHDETAMELPPDVILEPGEIVMFELKAEAPAEVRVWVETDGVRVADLGTFEATAESGMLADGEQLVAYGLGKTGTVVFRASSAPSGCDGDSCDSVVVTVR